MSVCLSVCVSAFLGWSTSKLVGSYYLVHWRQNKNFFCPKPFPSPKGKFFRNLNYSWTLWWIQLKISDNLSYTHTQLLEKNLSRTSHLNWVITQPLLKYVKSGFLHFCPLTPPRRLKISTSHFQLWIPLLHRRF